ncbi:MAG: Multicopper oxidase family protein [Parcubacteria group bacterium GW2011_GWD2_43_10]|nr:MAG: Multicopper oxidase family protein [Parcubacteria group bacterium GW2011_GWA2_42_80]KKS82802.1 MAG: Multicopper oxidase family protein [Parcubacteria group bacterium GW2011_GWD2_43_10]KKS92850.1 MAG: Multicopper oxidase family protein [Parcubacteria group bacterium GW2011_GWE2_43_12]HBT91869.1 copper oxidase [Candidatus Veblenbacteria bacterium]
MKQSKYILLYFGALLLLVGGVVAVSTRHERIPLDENTSGLGETAALEELPEAQVSTVVELKNGGTFDLAASFVQKKLGNRSYRMLAYNGSIPGPLIKVSQGADVTINFKNGTDMKTLLHSHGVRMDNAFDGSQTTQKEMEPGETFAYKLKFPDAGMYWYHPHVREDYAQELGLYGNYLVVPNDKDYWSPVNREVALFLDDILIENEKINLSRQGADHTLMGRFGNIMLVNGEPDYRLEVKRGELIRFYVTNAANTRTFNFTIPGVKMKLVGGDGGATEREEWKDAVIVGPSERLVVEVLFDKEGSFTIQNKTPDKTYALGTVSVSSDSVALSYAEQFVTLRTNTIAVKSIDPYRQYFGRPIDKRLTIGIDLKGQGSMMGGGQHMMMGGMMMDNSMMAMPVSSDGIEWEDDMAMMNQGSTNQTLEWKLIDEDTRQANMDIDWNFKVGDKVKIRITNDANSVHPMQHPIHFHGQQFLVLDQNGKKGDNLVWKDTVLIPAGQYADILLNITNPGDWMAHCHIAEHLESGMMMKFQVD